MKTFPKTSKTRLNAKRPMGKHSKAKRLLAIGLSVAMLLSAGTAFAQEPDGEDTSEASSQVVLEESSITESPAPSGIPEDTSPASSEEPVEESDPSSDPDDEAASGIADAEAQGSLRASQFRLNTGSHEPYMSGYAGQLFKPDKAMTRAEFVTVIYNLLTNKPAAPSGQFSDVADGQWYTTAINALANGGLIHGDSKGFRPNDNITREEAVKILTYFIDAPPADDTFTDVAGRWSTEYILVCAAKGWIGGFDDGSFRPTNSLTRAQMAKIMNVATNRKSSGNYAQNRDKTEYRFKDVPTGEWYFLDVTEAAKPLPAATPTPTPTPTPPATPNTGSYIVTTDEVNFRTEPSVDKGQASVITAFSPGVVLTVVDDISYGVWIKATSTTLNRTGYIHSGYVKAYTPTEVGPGNGTISTTNATVPQYKTLLITGNGGLSWRSDNENVAVVFSRTEDPSKAFIYGKSAGTATISMLDATGAVQATCAVTVSAPEAARYVYSDPITPIVGKTFAFKAITDSTKTAVRFTVSGAGSGTFETTTFSTETKTASTQGLGTNTARIFTASVSLPAAGSYVVRAYSKDAAGNWSTSYVQYSMLVSAATNMEQTTTDRRGASADLISVLANFEGTRSEVYIDTLASSKPATVGCGSVINKNETFYNNLTTSEINAELLNKANNGGYVTAVNEFREKYNFKMNQYQFDCLVSFCYNLGPNYFGEKYETFRVLLNACPPPSLPATGTLNNEDVEVYSDASSKNKIGVLSNGTSVTVTEIKRINDKVDQLWYKIKYGNGTAWIRGGHVRFSGVTRDLAYIDEQLFGSNLLEWNSAGSTHYEGLLLRRLAEAKIFCYGNYEDAYHSSPNYKKNVGFDVPPPFN